MIQCYRVSKKRRPFLKIENIPYLLTDDKKGKIIETVDFQQSGVFYGKPCTSNTAHPDARMPRNKISYQT